MIKKLSVLLVAIAALVFAYGATMTAFAEEGSADVSVSSQTSVTVGNEDRGGWWGNDEVREERKEMRDDRPSWFNFFRSRKAEFKEDIRGEVRADIKQNRRGLIEARWNMLGSRFENVIIRIESRIEKMEAEGKDTDSAETHVANAKASLRAAQAKAVALAEAAEDQILDKETVMKAAIAIKADLEAAKVELKLAIRVLAELNAESEDEGDDNE